MPRRLPRAVCLAAIVAASFLPTFPAWGVIEAKNPLSQIVSTTAQTVQIGVITAVDKDAKTITLKIAETVKGAAAAEVVTLTVRNPATVLDTAAANAPAVLFHAKGMSLVHVGNEWLLARAAPDLAAVTVTGRHATGARDTFPGTTAGLAAAVQEFKAGGKSTLLDKLPERCLNGAERELAKLPVKNATAFSAADVNADGKTDLLIAAEGKQRVFVATDKGYEDQTDKGGAKGAATTQKFPPDALAAASGAFGHDTANYYLCVSATGLFRVREADATSITTRDKPGLPIDDDVRLTGSRVAEYHDVYKNGFKAPVVVPLDANGDGRMDLFLTDQGAAVLLLNRGFGTFLVDPEAAKLAKHAEKGALLAAAALDAKSKKQSLLILTADGTVFAVDTVAAP